MVTKVNTGHELYVYMNGTLLYKRWLGKYGMVFCDVWGHRPFTAKDSYQSITDDPSNTIQTLPGNPQTP